MSAGEVYAGPEGPPNGAELGRQMSDAMVARHRERAAKAATTEEDPPTPAAPGDLPARCDDPSNDGHERDSWAPFDLGPYLRGEIVQPRPTLGATREDGLRLLYPGREHAVIGEMESGKSWLVLLCVMAVLLSGGRVVYVHFEESDPADTVERLRALGVPASRIAADLVFVGPEQRVTAGAVARLVRVPPVLVVLDGQNEAMALHGQEIMGPDGAAAFRARLVKPFTGVGAAVVTCDHVVKDPERNRQGYALGSVHKGNGLNGSLFLLENVEPFGRGLRGVSHLYVTKDRPGYLRAAGQAQRVPRKFYLGSLILDATGERLSCALTAPAAETPGTADGSAARDLDAAVLAAVARISATGLPVSMSQITEHVTGRSTDVRASVQRLVTTGALVESAGPRNSRVFDLPDPVP